MRAVKVQASLRISAVWPEPPLLTHTSRESRGTLRQKARSLAPLNGWACAVKICHDEMLEDTNSLDASQVVFLYYRSINRDDLQDYVKAHYKGPRVVLAAAGGKYGVEYEPCHEKSCLWGLRPGKTQTSR